MKTSNHYHKIVEWSEEDQCYVGTCPGLMQGGIHGDDEEKVYKEFCQAVEEWIEIYQEDREPLPESTAGRDYSGKIRRQSWQGSAQEMGSSLLLTKYRSKLAIRKR
jgi:predicted RNase H-like HicB family nuclease